MIQGKFAIFYGVRIGFAAAGSVASHMFHKKKKKKKISSLAKPPLDFKDFCVSWSRPIIANIRGVCISVTTNHTLCNSKICISGKTWRIRTADVQSYSELFRAVHSRSLVLERWQGRWTVLSWKWFFFIICTIYFLSNKYSENALESRTTSISVCLYDPPCCWPLLSTINLDRQTSKFTVSRRSAVFLCLLGLWIDVVRRMGTVI